MPVYKYVCRSCEVREDAIQRMDEPPPLCKKCKAPMEKSLGKTSFALRGSGWFKDGY